MTHSIRDAIREIRERAEKADDHICDLASGKARWQMCVPPQDDDSDMLLSHISRTDIPRLCEVIEIMTKALEFYSRCYPEFAAHSYSDFPAAISPSITEQRDLSKGEGN